MLLGLKRPVDGGNRLVEPRGPIDDEELGTPEPTLDEIASKLGLSVPTVLHNVRELRQATGRPVIVGFGISTPEHVRMVCSVADGAIIGSALVRRIMQAEDAGQGPDAIVETAASAVREWMTGLP